MNRIGITLIELSLGITIIGILSAIAVPRLSFVADSAAVRLEAQRVTEALDAARGSALRFHRPTELTFESPSWQVSTTLDGDDIITWRAPDARTSGVTISGTGAPIRFGRAGIGVGASNRTIVLTRGLATRRIVISRLGRITSGG